MKIICNVVTGETQTVPLTQAEIDAALARKAQEGAYNHIDNAAPRAIDATDRLWFDVNFNQENRIRELEAKPAITKAQYRDALIAVYKTLP